MGWGEGGAGLMKGSQVLSYSILAKTRALAGG